MCACQIQETARISLSLRVVSPRTARAVFRIDMQVQLAPFGLSLPEGLLFILPRKLTGSERFTAAKTKFTTWAKRFQSPPGPVLYYFPIFASIFVGRFLSSLPTETLYTPLSITAHLNHINIIILISFDT